MTSTDRALRLRRRLAGRRDVSTPALGRNATATVTADNLVAAFDEVAGRHPDRVAVRCDRQALTYRELASASRALASRIATVAPPGQPVGVLLPRSARMIVAALAVLRTGAAYLPLDPEAPAVRTGMIVGDAAPPLVITTGTLAGSLPATVAAVLLDASDGGGERPDPPAAPVRPIAPTDRAYVIHTSGTTGRPKGIEVSHANVLRLIGTTQPLFGFGPGDVWTMAHSFAFDFSVWEMWGALLTGGCVVVVGGEVMRDPVALRRLLRAERVTMLSQTPTAFGSLAAQEDEYDDRLPLRWVVFGGEALRFADLRPWVAKYGDAAPELVNMYGITETTVHASYRRILASDIAGTTSLIGAPLPDLGFLLWDEDDQPVADGEIGQIIVTGAGVALGYLGQPELTAQRFVTVTDAQGRPVRGYRSGDLARRTPSGEYEYHGRNDDQVKIRGYRLELGEVHAALVARPGVRQAAVVPHTSPGTGTRLVAYVVGAGGVGPAELRSWLEGRLPGYAVPSAFVLVDALPRTANGKLDREALPDPGAVLTPHVPADVDDVTRSLLAILAELLPGTEVEADTDFFRQGGNSLLATRLLAAVRRQFGVVVPLRDFLKAPTIRAVAGAVRRARPAGQTVASRRPVDLLPLGDPVAGRAPVVALPGVFGIGASMARLSTHVRGRPFYALHTRDLLRAQDGTPSSAVAAQACLTELLPVADPGVHLVGHSLGGAMALHLAHAMRAAGSQVRSITLLDAPSPRCLHQRLSEDHRTQLVAFLSDVALAFPEHTRRWRELSPQSAAGLADAELLRWAASTAAPALAATIGELAHAFEDYRTMGRIMAEPAPALAVPALLLVAGLERSHDDDGHTEGWHLVLPNLTETVVASSHEGMLRDPGAATVAETMIEFQHQQDKTEGNPS
ncbi:amino acid adenylation domain-containing protein [Micromonospora sp. M71_S20]|uniref:amino acid adenylation domain-containing protein n=1 Tax=Micromonospora sp. M71_S20 TaxID=592872 RepID=UPI000EB1E1CC|nr:amino acid adenylation domain-containing protein [Micromonospora sp. M71_S20]RLK09693.1 amino acid adenylation domain-containing protein [Micromonospora sp. M71_S20]